VTRRVALGVGAVVAGATALAPALGPPGRAAAQEHLTPTPLSEGAAVEELDHETLDAIDRGITWLAGEQLDSSGRWPSNPQRYQMSVTALAGLALLAHGDTPDSGRHARAVRKAVEWVLASQKGADAKWPGLIFDGAETFDQEDRPMHGHGFALLFLAEAYGQTRDPVLRQRMHDAIAAGARLTERTITRDGGWFYTPDSLRDEGSVTVTQIQALRSARNAGIAVDATVVARAVAYIKNSQQPDGGVRYTLRWGKASAALTAAGMSVLQGAGEYESDAIDKGFAYLRQELSTDPNKNQFFYYTHLYAVQAMFQRGGPEWANYYPRIRRELLDLRRGYPYWDSPYGRAFGTSISLLILQVPLRYLPIFQR
jgi:hypothetical protein